MNVRLRREFCLPLTADFCGNCKRFFHFFKRTNPEIKCITLSLTLFGVGKQLYNSIAALFLISVFPKCISYIMYTYIYHIYVSTYTYK